ncbi:hypothetical protein E4U31_001414 [Claviceps sp. LM219 group G6]|nr:hypothetical protein E4U31_001414 [Claviceps sp. LM219 group G6]
MKQNDRRVRTADIGGLLYMRAYEKPHLCLWPSKSYTMNPSGSTWTVDTTNQIQVGVLRISHADVQISGARTAQRPPDPGAPEKANLKT